MSNTKHPQGKDTQPAATEDKAASQAAQANEALDTPATFTFDGHSYTVPDGQPSPRALTYLARWTVDDENMALVLAMQEMIGPDTWALWCTRHRSEQLMDFWRELNRHVMGAEGN